MRYLLGIAISTLALLVAVFPMSALAAASGPRLAGTGANDATIGVSAWGTPGNVTAQDGSYTFTGFLSTSQISNYLKATNFGFTIPTNAKISGIQVEIYRADLDSSVANRLKDSEVKIVKGGTITGSNLADTSTFWEPTVGSPFFKSYGGASELWGTTWTAANINASDFGVVVAAQNTSGSNTRAAVDAIRITVTYTLGQTKGTFFRR